jgi:multicomponent K+:H+ antiporter subunit F
MISAQILPWVIGALALAMALCVYRLIIGPAAVDRVLALDTLYVSAMALVIALGLRFTSAVYFEVALLIALLGFLSTVALARYLATGRLVG